MHPTYTQQDFNKPYNFDRNTAQRIASTAKFVFDPETVGWYDAWRIQSIDTYKKDFVRIKESENSQFYQDYLYSLRHRIFALEQDVLNIGGWVDYYDSHTDEVADLAHYEYEQWLQVEWEQENEFFYFEGNLYNIDEFNENGMPHDYEPDDIDPNDELGDAQ
jgi:hypothetical protein